MTGAHALVILQARLGSTRLPGKVLADVGGTTLLARCIARLQAADVGPVLLATTTLPEDDLVAAAGGDAGIPVVRGSREDVLARYVQAAGGWAGRHVLRATGDNPLVDVEACRRVLEYLRRGADYVLEKGLPVGAAVEGMTTAALREAGRKASDPYDREHVTPWLRRHADRLVVVMPAAPASLQRPDLRFTIDTADDLAYVRQVVDLAGRDAELPLAAYIDAADRLAAARAEEAS
jgi:spore coat polysaccharide biosynthesis protein SpsF (cytidylyltransferase family)